MSNLAYARPATRPASRPAARPPLQVVTTRAQRKARPKVAYAVVTVSSLFLIFAAQLLLSIVVSDGAYQIQSLQTQQKELLRTEQALQENLAVLSSTQNLATQAAHIGMVPNPGRPYSLDLSTGAIFEVPGSTVPCGGTCNLVPNAMLGGVPLVSPVAPEGAAGTVVVPPPAGSSPSTTVDDIPTPVTH
jgi:hypothetical protein